MTKEELLQTYFYIEDISGSENTVSITKNNASAPTLNLEYTTTPDDDSSWITATMSEDTTANTFTIPANGKLYLRGVNNRWGGNDLNYNYDYNIITCSGEHNVGGNTMSLLYGSEFEGKTSFPSYGNIFPDLFRENKTLISAENLLLPSTTAIQTCYQYMFYNCTSLTKAPELPATIISYACYRYMFYNCTSLTTPPELPGTNASYECYYYMFYNCTSLTTTPELPATTLETRCYSMMFYNCTSLTSCNYVIPEGTRFAYSCYGGMYGNTNLLPEYTKQIDFTDETIIQSGVCVSLFNSTPITDEYLHTLLPINEETGNIYLPCTTLSYGCYSSMFVNCTLLTTAPELPATTLAERCYDNMFNGCSSLTTAPELPATTLAECCYASMFDDCKTLTTAPALPATTLAKQCYYNMFSGCSSLTTAPELPATTLTNQCYQYMFWNCSKLNYIKADFINYSNNNDEFSYWVQGVSNTGTFIMNPDATYNVDEIRGINGIPTGWNIKTDLMKTPFYIEDISGSENTISITKNNANSPTLTIEYSIDNKTWITATMNSGTTANTFTIPANGKLYLRGVNDGWGNFSYYNTITCNGNHNVGGNIMSLLYGTEFINKTSFPTTNGYVLKGLFHFNNKLVNAQDLQLPATTLAYGCYSEMFYSCYSLTTAPELPATTLTGDCYYWMFMGCSSLTTAPELPATTLAHQCYYYMFYGCKSLTTAPELPATTLDNYCYNGMFYDCIKLTTAPELPATTLANKCYREMFWGCSKLNYIKADFINYNSNNTTNWVKDVSSTGTFVMNPNATYNPENIRGVNGIPTNWNVHTNNYFYIEDISNTENIVSITKNNASAPTLNLEYSYNKSEWFSVTMNSDTTANTFTLPANGKIYFRGVNNGWCDSSNSTYYNNITTTGSHNVGGNIMSLLYGSNIGGKTSFPTSNNRVLSVLFRGNTKLVNAKDLILPATTLTNWCYSDMFSGCSSLTTAPALPATTLANNCYDRMFQGCNSLTTAPELPATTLGDYCYASMFQDCISLSVAPELPATTLAYGCYHSMFRDCTSLTTAPELPATKLNILCYVRMFYGCTSLTTAPELPATTLDNSCYYYMFYGCSKLNYIKADFIEYDNSQSQFTNWVKGVAKEGTFKLPLEATYNPEDIRGVDGIPTGWNIEKIYSHTHIYNDSQDINTLIIKNNNSDLECLVDMGTEWVSLPHNETSNIEFENVIIIKGNNTTLNGVNIKTSNPSTLNGNIMSLLYGNDYKNKIVFPENSKNTFKYLFLGYDKLVDISKLELPATELASNCYHHMFTGCKSLKTIPELPANDLTNKCYHGMFMNCDGIDKATLSAQYLAPYAYSNMFLGSDNLNEVTTEFIEFDETSLKGWLEDTAEEGTLYLSKEYPHDIEETTDMLCVPSGWDVITK